MSSESSGTIGCSKIQSLRSNYSKRDRNDQTGVIAYIGEVGTDFEERATEVIEGISTPVFASVVGRHAPAEKKMGHAGVIADAERDKLGVLREAGATVVDSPFELPSKLAE